MLLEPPGSKTAKTGPLGQVFDVFQDSLQLLLFLVLAISGARPTQLAALLGKKKVAQIWKTDGNPPRISIIDVIAAINGKDKNHAAEDLRRISTGHPEVNAICVDFKFPEAKTMGAIVQNESPEAKTMGSR